MMMGVRLGIDIDLVPYNSPGPADPDGLSNNYVLR